MTNLLAIDPGYAAAGQGCAFAYFCGAVLKDVWFARSDAPRNPTLRLTDVVVEKPQEDGRSVGITSVLINLAWEGALVAGMYAGQYNCRVISRSVREWKGSCAKPPHHKRALAALTYAELGVFDLNVPALVESACRKGALARWKPGTTYYPKSFDTHNLLDAVALGLTELGRLHT